MSACIGLNFGVQRRFVFGESTPRLPNVRFKHSSDLEVGVSLPEAKSNEARRYTPRYDPRQHASLRLQPRHRTHAPGSIVLRPHLPSCRDDARPLLPSVVLGPHLPSCRDNARSASAYTHGRHPDSDVVARCCSRAHGHIIRRVHRVKAASCVMSRQCKAEW